MGSGGYRTGAGRPKKSAAEKALSGNPGKRPIEVVNFEDAQELPSIPAKWLTDKGKEIYKEVYEWLKTLGCTKGIMPCHLEEYAHCKSRWHECEEQNSRVGLIIKDSSGKAAPSPFVQLAGNYLKQSNDAWGKIYTVVRETKLTQWDDNSPHDDVMEQILSGKWDKKNGGM
jgi:phage terminase small subunit